MSEQKSVEKISMLSDAFFWKNFGANLKSQIPHSAEIFINNEFFFNEWRKQK